MNFMFFRSQLVLKTFVVYFGFSIINLGITPITVLPTMVSGAPSQQTVLIDIDQITVTGQKGNYNAQILVNSPPEAVWKLLTNYEKFPTIVPDLVSSKITETQKNQKIIEQVFFASYTFGLKTKVKLKVTESYLKDIDMQLVKSDHLKVLQGRMQLTPKGNNQTLITYTMAIEPKFDFIKQAFYKAYEEQLLQNLRLIKKAVESN